MLRWLRAQLLSLTLPGPTPGTSLTTSITGSLTAWGQAGGSGAWRSLSIPSLQTAAANAQATQGGDDDHGSRRGASKTQRAPDASGVGSRAGILQRFSHFLRPTPPVSFIEGMPAPTAMSWLRRRGPEVPHTLLHRLFRQREVRLVKDGRVIRVSASRQMCNGDILLYPNWVTSQAPSHGGRRRPALQHAAAAGAAGGDATARADPASPGATRGSSHAAAGPGPGSQGEERSSRIGSRQATVPVREPMLPNSAAAKHATPETGREEEGLGLQVPGQAEEDEPPTTARPPSAAQVLTPERVRRWVLAVHPGLLFINKPAGVRVHGRSADDGDDRGWKQREREREGERAAGRGVGRLGGGGGGGGGGAATLDDVMQRALKFGEADEPRLVHRLDQQASGAMVIARNADAATWLSAAFQAKAQAAARRSQELDGNGEERGVEGDVLGGPAGRRRAAASTDAAAVAPELSVRRTYWAFLAGDLQPRQNGTIKYPIVVDGVSRPCLTTYRVKATGCGVTWVELTPETGRRHQLRIHCARKLGAPIIGDARYGYRGLPPRLSLRDRLPPEWWALLGERPPPGPPRQASASPDAGGGGGFDAGAAQVLPGPILLHARELVVRRPGKAPMVAVAPLPRYIRELIAAAGWPQPATAM